MCASLKLSLELIPSTAWSSNVRMAVKKSEWDKIRRKCYQQANYLCQICGGKGSKHPVECHEIWEWIQGGVNEHTQKLVGLIALCPTCHRVKHLGRVQAVEPHLLDMVLRHFARVNQLDDAQCVNEIAAAYETWRIRSLKKWKLDISYLTDYLS